MALLGCGGGPPSGSAPAAALPGTTGRASGILRDLDAAVGVAASLSEMAVVRSRDYGAGVRVYEMRSIHDEPVTLRAEGLAPVEGRIEPGAIVLTASVGRFGDPAREAKLIDDVRKRLADLASDPNSTRPHPVKEWES